jgi:hypothetical protein
VDGFYVVDPYSANTAATAMLHSLG